MRARLDRYTSAWRPKPRQRPTLPLSTSLEDDLTVPAGLRGPSLRLKERRFTIPDGDTKGSGPVLVPTGIRRKSGPRSPPNSSRTSLSSRSRLLLARNLIRRRLCGFALAISRINEARSLSLGSLCSHNSVSRMTFLGEMFDWSRNPDSSSIILMYSRSALGNLWHDLHTCPRPENQ